MAEKGLTILMDRAGTGKTAAIFRDIAKEGLSSRQMLLVPEHASHQAERDLCAICGDRASRHATVASFRWLAADVLACTGGVGGTVLDSGGKILTMYRALQKNLSMLKVYRRPSQKAAFLEELLHLDDELRSYRVDFEELLSCADTVSPPLGNKLRDLVLICNTYEGLLTENGRDSRDLMERLLDELNTEAGRNYFRGMHVYADGFLYFNSREELVLRHILRHAASLTVSVMGDRRQLGGVFGAAQQVRSRLLRIAEEEGIPCRTVGAPEDHADAYDPALRYLEQRFFGVLRPFEGENRALRLYRGGTTYDEVEHTASEIRRLVASGTCRYRDILVSARNMEEYEDTIENVFERYEIPAFLNRSSSILEKPVIALVLSALDIVSGGWEYEDMFRYLKTGMAGITAEESDLLENYVLKWQIRGRSWTKDEPWQAHPEGYDAEMNEAALQQLEALNQTRERVRVPLLKLADGLKSSETVRGQVTSLYRFLEEINLPKQLQEKNHVFRERGDNKRADEYAQIWKILCGVMDQFVFILGELEMNLADFGRMFRLVLTQYEIGTIPAALDQVSVTEITRNDRHCYRYEFLLGVNDHVLPAAGSPGGILTDSDRSELLDKNLRLAPFGTEQMNMELVHLYGALSQATEGLSVSWASIDLSGAELRPAFVVSRLHRLFPALAEELPEHRRNLTAPIPALEAAGTAECAELPAYFAGNQEAEQSLAAMDRARTMNRGRLSRDAVRTLYGESIRMSASRIDRINSCHFSFFMQYGLKAKERSKAGLDAPEIGTFLHYLLENTAREAKLRGGFSEFPVEERHRVIEHYIEQYAEEKLGGLAHQSARFRYLFNRLKKTAYAIVDNVADELAVSDFVPLAFELDFSNHGTIPAVRLRAAGTGLTISGKVDRVDGWLKNGKLYLRVVDYKTGKKKFDLAELLHGVGIQMLLYLFTLERCDPKVLGVDAEVLVPAGVEYLPARDAILPMDRGAQPEQIARAMEKELKRSGMFLNNAEVLEAMEHGCTSEPCYLPLTVKKDGSITSGVATAEQLGKLSRYVDHILEQICVEMSRGNIDADPNYQGEQKNACLYCPYASACHFEEGQGSDRREYIASVKEQDFWDELDRISEKGAE